ncbi:hypothetical protein [Pacificoceanicola onchidii]|uniref:hypothetical protein n=1 Tax=Pacificoceanicola onchidii TaxID=2562685 RepID=UPI001455FEA0|nr:hypothetical protein [Pacificoceanicola onchidii]
MSLSKQHEIHTRRFSRNLGLGLTLAALVAIFFGMTVVKVTRGDYQMQPSEVQNGN